MHSKDGSGHLAHAGQGGQGSCLGQAADVGQAGQTGGTTSDFSIYKSSWPFGIWLLGTPGGSVL